jgi:uncharacterized protein (TIGR00297 family)
MLVWVGVPVLGYAAADMVSWWLNVYGSRFESATGRYDDALIKVFAISIVFSLAAWRLRAATPFAAVCGGVICMLITGFTQSLSGSSVFHSGLTPLILLFVLTFEATRLGKVRKRTAGLAESRNGRNAGQIIANLGVAGFFCTVKSGYVASWFSGGIGTYNGEHSGWYWGIFWLPSLAALAEATADTVSSEIGQAFGNRPFLLTTFRQVQPGTDGAVSLLGSLTGIVAAAIVAFSGMPAMGMSCGECSVAFAAGVAGLFFDSLLGATVERKGWIGNDLVNFSSTAFAAVGSLVAIRFLSYRLLF